MSFCWQLDPWYPTPSCGMSAWLSCVSKLGFALGWAWALEVEGVRRFHGDDHSSAFKAQWASESSLPLPGPPGQHQRAPRTAGTFTTWYRTAVLCGVCLSPKAERLQKHHVLSPLALALPWPNAAGSQGLGN